MVRGKKAQKMPPEGDMLRASPEYFINKVYGYLIAPHHANILKHYEQAQNTLDLAPRGCGKSRVGNIGYCSWVICNNPNARILILSDTDTHSVRFLSTIKNVLTTSSIIKEHYGNIVGPKWSDHELTTSLRNDPSITEASITALGMYSGAVTTGHYSTLVADDLANFTNTRTPGMRERAKTWWKTTVLPTLLPSAELRMLGTRYHFGDIYNMAINELGYDLNLQPAIIDEGTPNERSIWEAFMPLHTRVIDGQKVKGLYEIRAGVAGTSDSGIGRMAFDLQYMNSVELMKSGSIFHYDDFLFYNNLHREGRDLYVEIEEEQ